MNHKILSDMRSVPLVDAEFIERMLAHHVDAITMAHEALRVSTRAEIHALARRIISAHQHDLEQLLVWPAHWYPGDGLTVEHKRFLEHMRRTARERAEQAGDAPRDVPHTLERGNNSPRYATWVLREDANHTVAAQTQQLLRAADRPDVISFTGGQPAAELFPLPALERAFARAIREDSLDSLHYGPAQGVPVLREVVSERLARRGLHVSPDQLLITSGSSQGLSLLGQVLLDLGDTIITEAPTYSGALRIWRMHQPRFVPVPIDHDGLQIDALEETLREASIRPAFLYVLPTFQNPAGVTLSLERRRRLVELAHAYDLLIVEDDPYGEIWFDDAAVPPPPVRALPGAEERVIYLGSFSKILVPGLRLGFIVAPPDLMQRLFRAKQRADFHTSGPVQYAVAHLHHDVGFDLDQHIGQARQLYRARRDAMLRALDVNFPSHTMNWSRPAGGFFLWVRLPATRRAHDLLPRAIDEGVRFLPGTDFYPNGGGDTMVRLSYTGVEPERIATGIERLARALGALTTPS
jgi:2-aminoadipate transaminase